MIGTQVADTDGVIGAIEDGRFDLSGYDAFIDRQLGLASAAAPATGSSTHFVGGGPAARRAR